MKFPSASWHSVWKRRRDRWGSAEFFKREIGYWIGGWFIDRSHRLKSITTTKDGPKTIIVKFVIHDDKLCVYYTTKI